MDKQSIEFHIKIYGMTQTLETNSLLACVLWIIAAQLNGPIALLQLYLHLHSWTNPFLEELLQQSCIPYHNHLFEIEAVVFLGFSLDVLHHMGQNLI